MQEPDDLPYEYEPVNDEYLRWCWMMAEDPGDLRAQMRYEAEYR